MATSELFTSIFLPHSMHDFSTRQCVGFYFYYLYGDIIKIGIIHGSTTTTIPKGKHAPLTPRSPPSIVPMKPSLDDDNDSMNDSLSLVMYRWKGIASDDEGGAAQHSRAQGRGRDKGTCWCYWLQSYKTAPLGIGE